MPERLSILIADDEPIIRRKVSMMLGDRFIIGEASTAGSALENAGNGYDAILLDIVFPDGNGVEVCGKIKEADPYNTVIISSSLESVDAWNEAFKAGADGYLEKRELLGLDPRKIELMINNLVERNRLKRQAEQDNRRQTELLSVLSHDVRAPFQTLLGTIELLRRSHIPSSAAENVESLYQCAKDQLEFINSLLELLRLESGSIGLRRSFVDVNLPVNQSLQGLRILAKTKGITINTDLQPGISRIEGDLGRLCQLINNLVTNSIKFTPRGGTVTVKTRSLRRNGMPGVELAVKDTGIGIKPEDRDKIFQRFHKGRDRGTEGERGAGLGLSICKEIVHLHGGTLEVDDAECEGSLVKAWFPAEYVEATQVLTAPHGCEKTVQCPQSA
jgi:signal transduction histidine kinase